MEEEKKEEKKEEKEEEKKEEPEEAPNLINKTNEAADRLEKVNAELGNLLERKEKMMVEEKLGGTTEAGSKELTDDEKAIEGARKLLEGTGFDKQLFPTDEEKAEEEKK